MATFRKSCFCLFLCIVLLAAIVRGRTLTISDGVSVESEARNNPGYIDQVTADETCEQTYGFLPCTTTWAGNLFLILVYGYLMFLSATFLSNGSELLLEILGPGIVGGLFLPMLGALPDAMLILVSGLSGSTSEAQSQVSVGMGLLAGSTVMLLTVIWGICVLAGKCDIRDTDNIAIDGKDTRGFNWLRSGVSADYWTCYAAMIMGLSVIPFIVVQTPQLLNSTSGRHIAVLIALILSVSMLLSYCGYQICQPWIQKRRLAYAKHKHVISGILRHLRQRALGKLMDENGVPNRHIIDGLFKTIDTDGDNHLSASEIKAFVLGIQFEEIEFDSEDAVEKVVTEFDASSDAQIDQEEFFIGISKWLNEAKLAGDITTSGGVSKVLNDFHRKTSIDHRLLGAQTETVQDESDEIVENVENPRRIMIKAVLMLLLGTIIAAVFADPLVDVVDNFSTATSIPTFFISFIALPLATNSSEAVSAIIFASRKKFRTTSLTFSELYGAVTMNNVLCLSVFLALVYVRGLTWNFTSEVLVILIVCIVMSCFASFRTTFPIWTSILAFALYPFSLALVYVLDYVLGWS